MKALWLGCVAALAPQVGCALLTKSDAFVSRYFTPETGEPVPVPAAASGLELRLGRVNSAAYIKDKIVFRDSAYEVGYYEGKRWTENPEVYVRRAVERALFDRRGVRRVVYGAATTLDVDVVAFEEVLVPKHVGRVQLSYSMMDDRVVRFARSITVERPIASAASDVRAEATVEALSTCLVAAVDGLADQAVAELRVESSGQAAAGAASPP
jgi:cholesterol transport system auxiliary component